MNRNDPTVMKLAAEADCDPRSALAVLEGRAVRGRVGDRLAAAAAKLKLELPKAKAPAKVKRRG